MNEWGLPDWRDAQAYGVTKNWSKARWRWEFYRRRQDLREFFDKHANAIYQNKVENNGFPLDLTGGTGRLLQPHEPGFVVDGYYEKGMAGYSPLNHEVKWFTWGYVLGIPNPRISEQPERIIGAILARETVNFVAIGYGERDLNGESERLGLIDGEMGVAFNLNRPLKPQIEVAFEALRAEQVRRHGKALQNREHKGKRLTYLRVLDAREGGASWSQIARILEHKKQTEQSARDTWNQARALWF